MLRAAGGSLTGTSANAAGAGGTGDPAIAMRDLGSGIDVFVNTGTLFPSPASTLMDMDASGLVITLRAGAITKKELETTARRQE